MAETTKDYLIGTNQHASARIWPISLSLTLPKSVHLTGFDITNAQFPPREWLPDNVRLEKLDILAPVLEELRGSYDVVAIRFFSLIVKDNDVGTLLGNLLSLLKPGGYLQWIEPDISAWKAISPRPDIVSEASEALMCDATRFLRDFRISYDWLHALPSTCRAHGMTNVKQYNPPTIEAIRPIFGYGTVGAYEEFSYSILDRYGPTPALGSGEDLRKRLEVVRGELEQGVAFEQPIYVLVAQTACEE